MIHEAPERIERKAINYQKNKKNVKQINLNIPQY